jgi:hypothetical protein
MKKNSLLIITLCLVLALSAVPAFAGTTPDTSTSAPITNKLTDKEIAQIRNTMTKDGIDQETQNSLINKMQKGELLDCDNPEKLAAVPKDARTLKKGEMKRYMCFPDGSYLKSYMIQLPLRIEICYLKQSEIKKRLIPY